MCARLALMSGIVLGLCATLIAQKLGMDYLTDMSFSFLVILGALSLIGGVTSFVIGDSNG